jgi:hypothetical protein
MPAHRECPSPIVRRSSNGEQWADGEQCADGKQCSDGKRRSHGKNGLEGTERIEWLWPGRLALGHLSILTRGTMSGKSFLSADLAARVTNGFNWPDAIGDQADAGNGEIPPSAKPARVLIVPGNPSRARRLWPRLAAAGADLDRVVVDQADRSVIPIDEIVASIEQALTRAGDCKLVIFEPQPIAFASRGAELDEECAAFFQSLSRLAARREVALLAVVGLRHDFSVPVSKRQLGALASCGAAMSVWAATRHRPSCATWSQPVPLKPTIGRRWLFAFAKTGRARKAPRRGSNGVPKFWQPPTAHRGPSAARRPAAAPSASMPFVG